MNDNMVKKTDIEDLVAQLAIVLDELEYMGYTPAEIEKGLEFAVITNGWLPEEFLGTYFKLRAEQDHLIRVEKNGLN